MGRSRLGGFQSASALARGRALPLTPRAPQVIGRPQRGDTAGKTTADLPSSDVVRELVSRLKTRARNLTRAVRLELEGKLRPFEKALNRWVTVPPSDASVQMALHLLLAIDAELTAIEQGAVPGNERP